MTSLRLTGANPGEEEGGAAGNVGCEMRGDVDKLLLLAGAGVPLIRTIFSKLPWSLL